MAAVNTCGKSETGDPRVARCRLKVLRVLLTAQNESTCRSFRDAYTSIGTRTLRCNDMKTKSWIRHELFKGFCRKPRLDQIAFHTRPPLSHHRRQLGENSRRGGRVGRGVHIRLCATQNSPEIAHAQRFCGLAHVVATWH